MARRKKPEEHENHERWLVSYADFITLLFAFFVVMYSISAVNEGKFKVLSDALVAAFRSQPKAMEPIQIGKMSKSPLSDPQSERPNIAVIQPIPLPIQGPSQTERAVAEARERQMRRISTQIEEAVQPLVEKGLVAVRAHGDRVEVEIKTSLLFASGSARLEARAGPVLMDISAILAGFANPIRVEGFTDNRPIATLAFPSNWELSAARAASVVHLFTRTGVQPERLSAVGFGEHRPVAGNDSEEGRAQNRRVVLVILADEGAGHGIPAISGELEARLRPSAPPASPSPAPGKATLGEATTAPSPARTVPPERLSLPAIDGGRLFDALKQAVPALSGTGGGPGGATTPDTTPGTARGAPPSPGPAAPAPGAPASAPPPIPSGGPRR